VGGVALVLMCGIVPVARAEAQEGSAPVVTWSPDARLGYFGARTHNRDGSTTPRRDAFLVRLRLGSEARLTERLRAGVRVAGRFGTGQQGVDLYLRDHAPTSGGLVPGQVSLDELYVDYQPADRWRVRVGRMQTRADRMGLLGKSLDRKDSGNTAVTWTDGARLMHTTRGGWSTDLIVQRNPAEGPTNVARPPLSFTDARSRVTVFAAVGSRERWGPVVQRGVAITYMPGALPADATDGTAAEGTRDYVALVGRGALGWGLGAGARRFVLAGEAGFAPTTPSRSAVGLDAGDGNETGGLAVHLSGTIYDIAPGHNAGVAYGRLEPGWLISPDYRHNNHLAEGRYQWRITPDYSIESRVRWRRDLYLLSGSSRARDDLDAYFRLTLSF
jgi:hypothetical protein